MVGKWDDKDKGERMIMKGKWKTRAMAFVMAFSMGMSSMISSSVYAAAEQPETKVETETQVFEEQTEEKVRAEDIVKDVSDKEFRVETSMEGISYDPERESVLLSEIKDQDGGSFQPENPGVYYAQYLVTPKDGSEPYMIGRTITLTDTEGLAHSESNGGEKQKEDTSSEEESEQPLPVEITSSQPEDTPDVLAELERDIEEGNVMMFSAADGMGKSETVHLNKGRTIYYPDYLGNYLTCLFTVNGKLAYCLESHRASPPTGDYVADILESNKNLQKVLYYGYGGAGDITGSYLSGKSDDEKYVYTHLAASYAYCGDLAFTGCPYENLVNAGVIAYINHLFGMEEPPKGELSFSNANVTAVREGDIQKTPDITLNGDHRNKITIPVPQGVTGYNKSKGTNVSGGNLEVYGGDTFYLQAPLTVTGKWESGQLYGSVRESWKTLVLTSTGGNNQDIGAFISEKAAPVSFDIQWLNLARVKILKKDAETGNPLDGAVYGVYKNSTCTDQLLTIAMTGEDGISYSDYFDAALETVYVKEITAPNGYAINKTVYPVHVSAGSSVEVEAVNTSVKGKITVKKQDVDTGDFLPQGDAKLDGAVYGLYAKEDIQKPDGTGVLYKAGSLIQEKTFGKSGEIVFENVYLGAMYVKEIAAPEGYLLDETEYDATLIYEGQEKPIVKEYYRVKPLSDTLRILTDQYVSVFNYLNYNFLTQNWDESNVETILLPRLFEDLYQVHTGEQLKKDSGRISAEIYENVMIACLPVTIEELRKHCGYDMESNTYDSGTFFYRGTSPFGEVVDYLDNSDGTLTLYVDAVWPDRNTDCAFKNEIVIKPYGDGTCQYLSNKIQKIELDIPVYEEY